MGIQSIEIGIELDQDDVHHNPDGTQGVLLGHEGLEREINEHGVCFWLGSVHKIIHLFQLDMRYNITQIGFC